MSAPIPSSIIASRAGTRQASLCILADSNALPPRDYIQTMLAAFRDDTALVISMPIGSRPRFLGRCRMRGAQYVSGALAIWGPRRSALASRRAKNMMWRREVLDRAGGIRALAGEIAGGRRSTKDRSRARLARSARGHAVRTAAGAARGARGLFASCALGAAATRDLSGLFRAGIHERQFSLRCFWAPMRRLQLDGDAALTAGAILVSLYGGEMPAGAHFAAGRSIGARRSRCWRAT